MKSFSKLQKKFIKKILDLDKSKNPVYLERALEEAEIFPAGLHIGKPPQRESIQIYYYGSDIDDVYGKYMAELLEIIEITFWMDKSSFLIFEKSINNNISIGEMKINPGMGWMHIDTDLIIKGLVEYFSGQRVFVTEDLRQLKKDNFMIKEEKYLSSNKKISKWALGISILAFVFSLFTIFFIK